MRRERSHQNIFFSLSEIFGRYLLEASQIPWNCAKEIFKTIQDHHYDKKLGIFTCGREPVTEKHDSIPYIPASYHRIFMVLQILNLNKNDVFFDLGCGKGRVLFCATSFQLKKIVGVELRQALVENARENYQHLKLKKTPVIIIQTDAARANLDEGTAFFMYDPFGYETLEQVLQNLEESLRRFPRQIKIAYVNARYRERLDALPWLKAHGEIGDSLIFTWSHRAEITTETVPSLQP